MVFGHDQHSYGETDQLSLPGIHDTRRLLDLDVFQKLVCQRRNVNQLLEWRRALPEVLQRPDAMPSLYEKKQAYNTVIQRSLFSLMVTAGRLAETCNVSGYDLRDYTERDVNRAEAELWQSSALLLANMHHGEVVLEIAKKAAARAVVEGYPFVTILKVCLPDQEYKIRIPLNLFDEGSHFAYENIGDNEHDIDRVATGVLIAYEDNPFLGRLL